MLGLAVGFALGVGLGGCRRSSPEKSGATLAAPPASVALAGLPLSHTGGRIAARLETSEGTIRCQLDPSNAPQAVALFVGLATGRAEWLDTRAGHVVSRPLYRDLIFFRAVPNAFLQSGCPLGNGTGSPGYRIAVETGPNDAQRLAQPGALLLASYHPAPNRVDPRPPPAGQVIGSQFAIALGDLSHLVGSASVLGSCTDLERSRAIAQLVATRQREVRLERIVIEGLND